MNQALLLPLVVALYVMLGVSGELCLSRAMRRMPSGKGLLRYVVTTPLALVGTGLLTMNFVMFLALLSRFDVSLIVPSHAASYLLVALTARWLLHERVSPRRWVGVMVITGGVGLVLTTPQVERSPVTAAPAPTNQAAPRPLRVRAERESFDLPARPRRHAPPGRHKQARDLPAARLTSRQSGQSHRPVVVPPAIMGEGRDADESGEAGHSR